MKKKLINFIVFSLIIHTSFAQIDVNKLVNRAKEEGKNYLKDQVNKKMEEARAEYDVSDFNYAVCFGDNAALYETEERFQRSKTVVFLAWEKVNAKKSETEVQARDLNQSGEVLYATNRYWFAEQAFKKSINLYETSSKANTTEHVMVISNLGLLYHTTGRYSQAEELQKKALELRKKDQQDKTGLGASYNNLGVLYKDMGLYSEAEDYLNRAKDCMKKNGTDNEKISYALVLNNLAMLYQVMGKYKEAEEYMVQCLNMASKEFREKSANFVRLKVNLALLYQLQERYNEAEKIYLETIEIKKRRLGTKHPDYAMTLRNLASLYMLMGKTDKVEPLLTESVDIYKSKFGEDNPAYANAIYDLGVFYLNVNRTNEALTQLINAENIQKNTLSEHHPQLTATRENIAVAQWQKGNLSEARSKYQLVLNEYLYQINTYFAAMNDYEKSEFWKKIQPRFIRFYSFAAVACNTMPEIAADVYNYHIATKALLLSSSRKVKDRILNSGDIQLINLYNKWLDQKSYLAKLYAYTNLELKEENINRDSLENSAKQTEKELSKRSELFKQSFDKTNVSYKDIASKLPANSAAMEFIRINNYNFSVPDTATWYAALVLKNNNQPPVITIFKDGNRMDTDFAKAYLKSIKSGSKMEKYYKIYWNTLEQTTSGITTLFVSVDGIYNKINLNTLQMPSGKFLLEEKNIVYVTNTSDLLSSSISLTGNKTALTGKHAVLIGFPDYMNGFEGGQTIPPLPGTQVEINNIENILKKKQWTVDVFTESQATEENVKKWIDPDVLHIATHGFFMPDVLSSTNKVFGIEPQKAAENPLLRSGLMLTGAEQTVQQIETKESRTKDDGILNAYEAMILKLEKTQLVVLSACETGLGEIKNGEGVYGLQRAFQIAGSKTILISLWEVSDEGTQDLMSAFYKNWTEMGNMYEAFRKSQLEMKEKYKFPFFWGAFILVNR